MGHFPLKTQGSGENNGKKGQKKPTNMRLLIVCFAVVMIWRGFWNFLDIYFLPGHPIISNSICIIVGIVLLLIDDGRLDEL